MNSVPLARAVDAVTRTSFASAPNQRLASIPNAAAALGISTRQFYRLLQSGEMPCVRIGGRVLIALSELDAFVARSTATFNAGTGAQS